MRAKWMGVAVAAMVACIITNKAHAYGLDIDSIYSNGDGNGEANVSIGNRSASIILTSSYTSYGGSFNIFQYYNITGTGIATNETYSSGSGPDYTYTTGSADFTVENAHITGYYIRQNFDGTPDINETIDTYDTISGSLYVNVANYSDGSSFAGGNVGYRSPGGFNSVFDFDQTLSASVVPLPSSAPLFGFAVLAFGITGYGARRSKAA